MKPATEIFNEFYFLSGGGEMGELIRNKDWSQTPLGAPAHWPESLRTAVAIMLDNPFAMYIAWGEEYIQLYNDAYRPILGATKHPHALGISTRETFGEIWHIIESMFDGVMKGKAVGFPDFILPLNRNGYVEDCYFDFSYSPIRKDNGEIGGVLVTVIETTNKKKAEIALIESERRFRTMADNIPNLAWMANADGWIFWYNKKWHDYTGTTPEEMEGWGWQSVHHPDELPYVLRAWKNAIANGIPFEMTFPLKGKDGKFREFLTRVLPVRNEEGQIIQWFGTNTDITKQIEDERVIKESEQRFRTMAEATDVLIGVADQSGKATYVNKAWTVLTGRAMEDLLEYNWIDLVHPDDRENYLTSYLEAFQKKETYSGEIRLLDDTGKYRFLWAKGTPRFHADGTFEGYISSCIDITERKFAEKSALENERNLRNTILQAPVAMCILKGADFIVELANERMFELWGRTSAELMNKPIFQALPEASAQGFEELLTHVYTSGETFTAQDAPITLQRNGQLQTVYVNFVYEAYRQSDDTISGVLAVAIDVTEQFIARQRIEEEVKKRTFELETVNKDLQKSNEELAQFAYIASHDLQEPLRKISTFSDLLIANKEKPSDEAFYKYIKKINASSTRMKALIKDVLSYSELIKVTQAFEEVDLNKIVEGIKDDYELIIEQKNALIKIDALPTLEAIPFHMYQLFSNLIGNSLKFTKPGQQPIITITSEKIIPAKENDFLIFKPGIEYYRITFSDNGIGFSEKYAEQIFNIFQRLHGKSEYEGTGIGLAICKKIAINHQGDIDARQSSEEGAVFKITLPSKQF